MTLGISFPSCLSGLCMLGKHGRWGDGAFWEPLALEKPSQDTSTAWLVGWQLPHLLAMKRMPKLETGPLGMRSASGAGAMPSCRYLLEMVLAPGDARDCTRSVLPSLLTKRRAPRACLPPTQPHHRAAMSGMMAGGHGGHGLPCLVVSSTAQGIPGAKSHHSLACHPQHASHKWQAHGREGCPAWPRGPFF